MVISSFLKEVMPSSIILKEEIKKMIEQANKMVNNGLVELYISKENDIFFEVNIRIKEKYPFISNQKCQELFDIEDAQYPSYVQKLKLDIVYEINNMVKRESKDSNSLEERLNLNRSYLISSNIYVPSTLWLDKTMQNFKNKETVCRNLNNRDVWGISFKLIKVFTELYINNIKKNIFVMINNNIARYNEWLIDKNITENFYNKLKKLKVDNHQSMLNTIVDGMLDALEIVFFINNKKEDDKYKKNKKKIKEMETNIKKREDQSYCSYEKGNQELICLLKDISGSIILNYAKYDDLNQIREKIKELDIKTNNINSLILDSLVIFNSKKHNIRNDFVYKCEIEFINTLAKRTKGLNREQISFLLDKILSNLNENMNKKKGFKNICLEELELQKRCIK